MDNTNLIRNTYIMVEEAKKPKFNMIVAAILIFEEEFLFVYHLNDYRRI